jgi:hypothetical protein
MEDYKMDASRVNSGNGGSHIDRPRTERQDESKGQEEPRETFESQGEGEESVVVSLSELRNLIARSEEKPDADKSQGTWITERESHSKSSTRREGLMSSYSSGNRQDFSEFEVTDEKGNLEFLDRNRFSSNTGSSSKGVFRYRGDAWDNWSRTREQYVQN